MNISVRSNKTLGDTLIIIFFSLIQNPNERTKLPSPIPGENLVRLAHAHPSFKQIQYCALPTQERKSWTHILAKARHPIRYGHTIFSGTSSQPWHLPTILPLMGVVTISLSPS